MTLLKALALTVFLVICTGCTTPTSNATNSRTAGRYMQFKHPVSGNPALQLSLSTADGCAGMLALMRQSNDANELLPYFSCVDTSASASLPNRATMRNKLYSFLFDVEAISLEECRSFVEGMMKSKGKDNLEVVSSCAPR